MEDRDDTIPSPIQYWADCEPHAPALIEASKCTSYQELAGYIRVAADYLHNEGIGAGDTIATLLPRSARHIITLWAIWHLGAIAAPLSSRLPKRQLNSRLMDVGAGTIVNNREEFSRGRRSLQAEELISAANVSAGSLPDLRLPSDATLIYTSGSSGTPKAALHSHSNHYFSAKGSNENIPVHNDDRWMLSLPLHHVGGLAILFRCALAGAAVYISRDGDFDDEIANRLTHLSLVPTQLKRLLDRPTLPPASLKAVLLGGGPVAPALARQAIDAGWPIYITYGLTEMSSQVTTTPPDPSLEDLSTAGYPLRYREVKLAEDQEILVRGETRFRGFRDHARIVKPFAEGGWYATGDVGAWDEEGRLQVRGRKDHMIISGGENIQPEEIERVLQTSDLVEEAVVVGVSDDEFGQRPVAFVRWRNDQENTVGLKRHIRSHLSGFKVPNHIFPLPDDIERGIKPPRMELKELAESHL